MSPPTRRRVIGVMGGGDAEIDSELTALARDVGRLVAERGAALLTGGGGGVMAAAAEGAAAGGGLTVGVLPGRDAGESPPSRHVEVAIFTGLGDARNYVNVCSSDAVIAIGGRWGTLSEIALARKIGRPVVLLRSWPLDDLPVATSAAEAVEIAFAALDWNAGT